MSIAKHKNACQSGTYSYRQILRITFPVLVSLLMEQMIGMTDTAFLGRVGEVELGASAIAGIYYLSLFMVGFGFSIGAQILMARRNGEGHFAEVGGIFYQGMYFMGFLALVIFLVTKSMTPVVLPSILSSSHIYEATKGYLDWRVYGFFFSFAGVMFRAFFIGTTQTRTLTLNSLVMVLSNILFNYILINGKLGFPRLGIAGAAIGSSLAELVSVLFFVIYTIRRVDIQKYGLNKVCRFDRKKLARILTVSFWTMIQNFVSLSTWFLFFLFVEHLGERALAITNIIRSISGLLFMIVAAFASTCSALISNMIGAGREAYVSYTIRQHIGLSYAIVLPVSLLFALWPHVILAVYTDIPDLIDASVPSLWVYCTTLLFVAPGNIYFQAVSGTGNTRMAFVLELFTLVIYTFYIYYIIVYLRLDVALCWTSEHVYGFFILLLSYFYIRFGNWRNKTI